MKASWCKKTLFFLIFTAPLYSKMQLNKTIPATDPVAATRTKSVKKDWNFIVYIAANNNLHRFSIHNIRQMAQVGSTANINIIVQLDGLGQKDVTRYYIEKNNPVLVSTLQHSNATTSGTSNSLYNFAKWSIEKYPAKHQAIVLWNHGSGIKDPSIWGRMLMSHRDELFFINYETGLLELNRTIKNKYSGNLNPVFGWNPYKQKPRGIAFNDTHEQYLTNQDLKGVLDKIKTNLLGGKKIDLLCMDACHMAMVEIGSQVKSSVDFMAASEEVEPGSGYNYRYLLEPFLKQTMTPREFAQHTVAAYKKEYESENADYTQSAISLQDYEKLEANIKQMGEELASLMVQTESPVIRRLLRSIRRNYSMTTVFCDADYIDLCHFYDSLRNEVPRILRLERTSQKLSQHLKNVQSLAGQGLNLMQNYIIASASGVNLPKAYGLSIYFPNRTVHKSYFNTEFNKETKWSTLLQKYVQTRKARKKKRKQKA